MERWSEVAHGVRLWWNHFRPDTVNVPFHGFHGGECSIPSTRPSLTLMCPLQALLVFLSHTQISDWSAACTSARPPKATFRRPRCLSRVRHSPILCTTLRHDQHQHHDLRQHEPHQHDLRPDDLSYSSLRPFSFSNCPPYDLWESVAWSQLSRGGVSCPGVSCSGSQLSGSQLSGVNCPGVSCPGVSCPDTVLKPPVLLLHRSESVGCDSFFNETPCMQLSFRNRASGVRRFFRYIFDATSMFLQQGPSESVNQVLPHIG